MDELIPEADRKARWQQLDGCLGWELPDLECPAWVRNLCLGLVLTWLATGVAAWGWFNDFSQTAGLAWMIVLLMGGDLLIHLLDKLASPLAICFPTITGARHGPANPGPEPEPDSQESIPVESARGLGDRHRDD